MTGTAINAVMGSPVAFLGPLFSAFAQSNMAGKGIVIILVAASFVAWAVMISKYLELSGFRQQNLSFERRLNKTGSIVRIRRKDIPIRQLGPYAVLVDEALTATQRAETLRLRVGHVENALQRAVARQTMRYEERMVVLGSIVTGAPFLGLLGTVWGVMVAFQGLSGQATASIQSLAPGVAGALLTTVAGLMVAIPSVFGYNFLLSNVRQRITELENFASDLADRVELELEADAARSGDFRQEAGEALPSDEGEEA